MTWIHLTEDVSYMFSLLEGCFDKRGIAHYRIDTPGRVRQTRESARQSSKKYKKKMRLDPIFQANKRAQDARYRAKKRAA